MKHQKRLVSTVFSLIATGLLMGVSCSPIRAGAPQGKGVVNGDAVTTEQPRKEEPGIKEEIVEEEGKKERPPEEERKEERAEKEEEKKPWYKKYWWVWICPGLIVFIGAGFGIYYLVNWIKERIKK